MTLREEKPLSSKKKTKKRGGGFAEKRNSWEEKDYEIRNKNGEGGEAT